MTGLGSKGEEVFVMGAVKATLRDLAAGRITLD